MNKLNTQKFLNQFNSMLDNRTNAHLSSQLQISTKGDQADIINEETQRALNLRLNSRNVLFMKKVEAAKEKILNGTFGSCEECGEGIDQSRLMARPTAELCFECQEQKESYERNLIHKRRDLNKEMSNFA